MPPFTTLPPSARRQKLAQFKTEHKAQLAKEKVKAFSNRPPCPYCGQKHVHSVGFRNGIQHYRCTSCMKSYSPRTGTSYYWLHLPKKFEEYMSHMLVYGHSTLKEMCKLHKISMITAFDWRHKILSALNCTPTQYKGFIELRNSTLRFSRKGIKMSKSAGIAPEKSKSLVHLLITADYSNNANINVARIGNLMVSDIEAQLEGRIAENHQIIGPFNKTIHEFSRKKNLVIQLFSDKMNPRKLVDKKTKVLDFVLRQLVTTKTHGVSSKYLHHYARWVVFTTPEAHTRDVKQIKHSLKYNTRAWSDYTGLETRYEQFMQRFSDEKHVCASYRCWKSAKSLQLEKENASNL